MELPSRIRTRSGGWRPSAAITGLQEKIKKIFGERNRNICGQYVKFEPVGGKDSGWIQIYAENNQEAYDNMVMAYNIAENKDVRLPIMICQDGFITSHAVNDMEILDDMTVKDFVGEYEPEDYLLIRMI